MQTRNEWAVVAELTATLSEAQQWWLFITLPLQCEEDSPTVEAFIVDVWRRPVTTETPVSYTHLTLPTIYSV